MSKYSAQVINESGTPGVAFSLPFPVSINQYHTVWNNRIVISEKGKKYASTVKWIIENIKEFAGVLPIQSPIAVEIEAFLPDDFRTRDIDNIQKCLFDSLVKANVIEDDSLIEAILVSKKDKVNKPFVFVKIYRIQ